MSTESRLQAVMEGRGAYNKYAKLPAGGAALALPLWEDAIRRVEIEAGHQPVVLVDYGSSQGKNSLVPMQIAVSCLRQRLEAGRPIWVFHVDQPSNDFNALFDVLDADPERYTLGDASVFPAAVGRSFYEEVLPPGSVHLGWCSYAAVWLSRVPALIPGHFVSLRSTGEVRLEYERQAARDWEAFLALRAQELRSGGRLIVVLPGLADDGTSGFETIMDHANDVVAQMVAEGSLSTEERGQMALRTHPRKKSDLLAPFERDRSFCHLSVEAFETTELRDVAWTDYEMDRDTEALATKHALFFRSIFGPSLGSALERLRSGDAEALQIFGDRLEAGLRQRVASQPTPMHSSVQIMVLAKRN